MNLSHKLKIPAWGLLRPFALHRKRWYQVAAVHFASGRLRTLGTRPPGHGAAVTVFSKA
jgi:hypothetical protein